MTQDRARRSYHRLSIHRTASILGIVAMLAATTEPALAKPKHGHPYGHGHGHGRHSCSDDDHRYHRHHRPTASRYEHRHPVFAAPPRVLHRVEVYEPYYERTVYFRPHRHRHAVYTFPVAVAHGYAYQPYQYCEGRLFRGFVEYAGPRVHVGIGF
jgi:hypothetical protein